MALIKLTKEQLFHARIRIGETYSMPMRDLHVTGWDHRGETCSQGLHRVVCLTPRGYRLKLTTLSVTSFLEEYMSHLSTAEQLAKLFVEFGVEVAEEQVKRRKDYKAR